MPNAPILRRKRPIPVYPETKPLRSTNLPKTSISRNVLTLPVKRARPTELEPYVNPYCRDPAQVMELKQFVSFGCGACLHHRLRLDRSGFHCTDHNPLWPDGTNETCRGFIRRHKQKQR